MMFHNSEPETEHQLVECDESIAGMRSALEHI
jgi:hypothetical protein